MSINERRSLPPWSSLLLPLLLLLPPIGNVLYREFRDRRAAAPPSPQDRALELERELDSTRKQLQLRERELELISEWKRRQPDYTPRSARVLPLADPSPRRRALWISAGEGGRLERNTAVVSAGGTSGEAGSATAGALLGRVERVAPGGTVARVQTILDPYFRVRFRHEQAWGFLWGTGRTDDDGRPLLEIRQLGAEAFFEEGAPVFTDGGDGVYPEGILIGRLVPVHPGAADGGFQVRAEFDPEGLREVVLMSDRGAGAARAAIREMKP